MVGISGGVSLLPVERATASIHRPREFSASAPGHRYHHPVDGDHELLRAWQTGDDRAGEQLFRRHYQLILRFFHNKAGTQAHDLVQRTFLACLEARDRIRGDASLL